MSSKLIVRLKDDARPNRPSIVVEAREDGYGVCVAMYNSHGVMIGSVVMDYHGNQLQALVYRHFGGHNPDEPAFTHLLSPNVDHDLELKEKKDGG